MLRARALLEAGRATEARDLFRSALELSPSDRQALLGLGAAFEASGDIDSARAVYTRLAEARLPGRVRRHLAGRLHLLARRALELAAREVVANETTLTRQPPRPNAVAVFPFRYLGEDSVLRPLGRGLAQLLVTDLGKISVLTLLERERVQQLLAEIRLAEDRLVDPSTAVRSGRLLRAERVVQGSLFEVPYRAGLRADAIVVNTADAQVAARGSASDVLDQFFALEKAVLFQLVDGLEIPLTLAERERLTERPTANLLAFLAFSRGLEAEDRLQFAEAAAAYRTAARLDPAFREAHQAADRAASLQSAAAAPPSRVAGLLDQAAVAMSFLTENLNRVMPSGMENIDRTQTPRETTPPGQRDPLSDVGGGDRVQPPSGTGSIDIRVRRPQ